MWLFRLLNISLVAGVLTLLATAARKPGGVELPLSGVIARLMERAVGNVADESPRQLLAPFARLRNCASGYVARVKSDACRLFGIEVDGQPVELIEVRPTDGRIVQWKGHANGPADPARRRVVERFLVVQRLAVI